MKKTVPIATIPLNKEGWRNEDLILYNPKDGRKSFYITAVGDGQNNVDEFGDTWQAQQLLVLSDDVVSIGDVGKIVKYPWGIGKTIEHEGSRGIEVECITCTLKNNPYDVTFGTKARFSDTDVDEIIASYPQIEGTLPISKETVQAWIDAGTPGESNIEVQLMGSSMNTNMYFSIGDTLYTYNIDSQGNLLLEFGSKIDLKEIGEKLKDRVLFPDALERAKDYLAKVVNPSIFTDEEIKEKAKAAAINGTPFSTRIQGYAYMYQEGYKQALKDLGYE